MKKGTERSVPFFFAALEKGAFSRREAVTALAEEWKNEYRRMSR